MIERVCIILLANLLFFLKTLGYKYCSDDIPAFQRKKDPVKIRQWFWILEGRARHSFQVDHFITMIIHSLVCVFIYIGFGANDISFLASILFMLNPANNQGSVWIAGRGYVLSALGLSMSLAFPLVAPIALLGAMYYNAGFITPVIFLVSPYPLIAGLLPVLWLFHAKRFKRNVGDKIKMEMFDEDRDISPKKLVLATKTLGFYLVHGLVPIKTSFYHSFLQSAAGCMKDKAYTIKDRFFWIGLSGIVGIIMYMSTQPWSMVHFALTWYIVSIAPFLNFFRVQQEIGERYMYLPNVGLMFVLATVLANNPVASSSFLTMYATKMWFYMDSFQDDYYLVEQACINSPDAWFAWHVRAMKRWDSKSYQEAVVMWCMARMISPKEFKINFNLATACAVSKRQKEALQWLKVAEDNIPKGQEKQCRDLIDKFKKGECSIVL